MFYDLMSVIMRLNIACHITNMYLTNVQARWNIMYTLRFAGARNPGAPESVAPRSVVPRFLAPGLLA